jgi:hypothetical protein
MDTDYEKQREAAQAHYALAKPILFPALNEEVRFTAEGFNHIIFKRGSLERERSSQIMRFKLLPRAIRLIAHANIFQEFEESAQAFPTKMHKRRETRTKIVSYWGIIAIFEGRKIKVILRKIGNGRLHFWSVVPAWTTNKYRDTKFVSTMKGQPEED